jgi:thioredoxin 1
MAEIFTKANFESEVLNASGAVLVDFWASWCGPCRMVSPIIDELAEDYKGKIKIGKVNVDEESELASTFAVVSIPTVILFKNGKIEERLVGAYPKDEYEEIIDKHI